MNAPTATAEIPLMISPAAMTPDGIDGRWVVAEVLSRNEKSLAEALLDEGFDFFLPLVKRITTSHRRRRVHFVPIMPGYVFACSGDYDRLLSYLNDDANHVFELIEVHPAAQDELRRELTELHGAIVHNPNLGSGFAVPGRKCRVTGGPWQGKEGRIDASGQRGCVLLTITTLGQAVPLEIDVGLLEPI